MKVIIIDKTQKEEDVFKPGNLVIYTTATGKKVIYLVLVSTIYETPSTFQGKVLIDETRSSGLGYESSFTKLGFKKFEGEIIFKNED